MKVVRARKLQFIPSSHEDQQNPHVLKKVLIEKADMHEGRLQMVNWARLLPGATFNAHYHEDMSEVFLIIEGTVTMKINDEEVKVSRGDAVIVAPLEVHTMTNHSNDPLEYIVFGISREEGGKTIKL